MKVEELVYLSFRRTQNSERLLRKYAQGRVLDIGSGRGHHLQEIKEYGSMQVIGSDIVIDPQISRQILNDGIDYMNADCTALPIEDCRADIVYAHHVIEHINDVEMAVKELYRVLKPGGKLIICVPTISSKSFYIYKPFGVLAIWLAAIIGNKKSTKSVETINGRNRPVLVMGEKADNSLNFLENILGKINSDYLKKVLFNCAAVLYFSVQNHVEHRHKMLGSKWVSLFQKVGFKVNYTSLCDIFPHWITVFLPRKSYPLLQTIEEKANNNSFFRNYLSKDLFYVLEK